MTVTTDRLRDAIADRYRVDRELGVGGMATVFLAHDLRHDRDVAIKVLHPDLGAAIGGDRFLSEIRTTARLQHPHILPLLDSGAADSLLYYVMPLVSGETLRARLERERQLPIQDAVRIATEVADALGYAHGLGVIHRDIKPENILLQGGHALVADFGIALAVQTAGGERMTQTGLSLGTPQYMSPEQAMGERTIDARSDLYALAAVTYEMLIGEPPFTGPTVQTIVARVMSEEPRPLVTQRKAVPPHVEDAVLRGLEKLPADRWTSTREFTDALQGTAASTTGSATRRSAATARGRPGWRERLRDPALLTLAVITLGSVVFAAWTGRAVPDAVPDVVRFTIPATQSGNFSSLGYSTLSISPDGSTLVYVSVGESRRQQLVVRKLDEVTSRPIPGTEDAQQPFFSPDGKQVAFIRSNQLYRVPIDGGGAPQSLGMAPGTFNGAAWSSTGVIVVSANTGLFVIPETGGRARPLAPSKRIEGELYLDAPIVHDDAGAVIYSSWSTSSSADARIAVSELESGETTVLDLNGVHPVGVIDDVLVYVTTTGALMGVPIDLAKRRVRGAAVQLIANVFVNNTTGIARAALARNGTLFYQSGAQLSQVVMTDAQGKPRVLLEERREYAFPRLSPDGTQLALTVGPQEHRDIWVYDLVSGSRTRLTTDGTANERPEWSPDGTRVLYRTDQGTRTSIWWRPVDLSTPAAPLLMGERLDVFEAVLSPDGRHIAYQLDTTGADIYYRTLTGDSTPKAIANSPRAIESMPRISPDGRWVAFNTNESGRDEVVVQPFPGPGGRVQVSVGGGTEPVWSRDGRRLFYRGEAQLIAATIGSGATFRVAARDTLFDDSFVYAANPHANYDVTPDGSGFIFLKSTSEGELVVVANWRAELRRRMASAARR